VYTGAKSRSSTGKEQAQDLAVAALAFIAEDSERLQRFLAQSGLGPQNLRAILDYVAGDESLLIAFAAQQNLAPEIVMQARSRLVGEEAQDDP
jgi:hypothetical protein